MRCDLKFVVCIIVIMWLFVVLILNLVVKILMFIFLVCVDGCLLWCWWLIRLWWRWGLMGVCMILVWCCMRCLWIVCVWCVGCNVSWCFWRIVGRWLMMVMMMLVWCGWKVIFSRISVVLLEVVCGGSFSYLVIVLLIWCVLNGCCGKDYIF